MELAGEDVVDAFLPVGNAVGQPRKQAAGYLAEEHACLAHGVEEGGLRVAPQRGGQQVEHVVDHGRRGEHLVVAQVGQARQHVGVIGRAVHGGRVGCSG